jgi:hypothetical protein
MDQIAPDSVFDRNPVQWVRQSAKRKKIPAVLEIEEVVLNMDKTPEALLKLRVARRTLHSLGAGSLRPVRLAQWQGIEGRARWNCPDHRRRSVKAGSNKLSAIVYYVRGDAFSG